MTLLSPQTSPEVWQGALELSAGSYKTINILSPWSCGYVCEPCSASSITNSLRFLHWKSHLVPGVFKVKAHKGPAWRDRNGISRVELGQGDDQDMSSPTSLSVGGGPQSSSHFANQVGQDHNQSRAVCALRYLKKCKEYKHVPFLGLLGTKLPCGNTSRRSKNTGRRYQ